MRRKGEMTSGMIDSGWPHQVALLEEKSCGKNYPIVSAFCENLSKAPRGHSVRHGGNIYVVYCFSEQAHAASFMERFGGEPFNPAHRGKGTKWMMWYKP